MSIDKQAQYESKFSRLWERYDEASHGNAEQMRDILEVTLDALESAERQILRLEKLAEAESVGADKAVEWMKQCQAAENRIADQREYFEGVIADGSKRIAELEESHAQVIHSRDHYKRVADEGIKSLAEAGTLTVKLPEEKDSPQGWKVDPEFISKVQDAIGYDEECQCWEGTPSMEMVEAVLIAAAGIQLKVEE